MYVKRDLKYWEELAASKKKYVKGYVVDLQRGFSQIVDQKYRNEYDIIKDIKLKKNSTGETFFVVVGQYHTYGFNIQYGGIDNSSVIDGWTTFQADGGVYFAITPCT